jgi:hypothetical protein
VIQCQNVLEAKLHKKTSIWLLTYDPEHLPEGGVLVKEHLQKFIKRVRFQYAQKTAKCRRKKGKTWRYIGGKRLRYFGVGEYGTRRGRPHYHIVFYGLGYEEQSIVVRCWPYGRVDPGYTGATAEFARYIAGYLSKGNYKNDCPGGKPEEFRLQSRRPGLGADYFNLFSTSDDNKSRLRLESLSTIRVGRRHLPLGRYLSTVLRNKLEQDPRIKERYFQDYQFDMLVPLIQKGGVYYDEVLKAFSNDRKKELRRHQIYPRKESV